MGFGLGVCFVLRLASSSSCGGGTAVAPLSGDAVFLIAFFAIVVFAAIFLGAAFLELAFLPATFLEFAFADLAIFAGVTQP